MSCCFPRKRSNDIHESLQANQNIIESNLRGQLVSAWQYITDRDNEIRELKTEVKTLKDQNDKILETFEMTQKSLAHLKKSNHRNKSRARRYRKDNVILCQHLKVLTQNHPALGAEESEMVSKAITRHNQRAIQSKVGSKSSSDTSVSIEAEVLPELPAACWKVEIDD
jgi:uncharacterized protein (DUF3084 family)